MFKSKYLNTVLAFLLIFLLFGEVLAQDKAIYKERERRGRTHKYLSLDFSKIKAPESPDVFDSEFHFPPISQGWTGTCWCFSTISMIESDIYRMYNKKVKLSEMYVVYWEYIDKAKGFVNTKGESYFGQGSEQNAVTKIMAKHGIVREEDYNGLLPGAERHNHSEMFKAMKSYLDYVKENKLWDEEQVLMNIKYILNKHLGKPPKEITIDGKSIAPVEYMKDVLKFNPADYVGIVSFLYDTFYTKIEYKVPDNWWHSKEYHNVPLDEWYTAIKNAIKNGYTIAIGGDISEPGKDSQEAISIIPTYDIKEENINQSSKEYRFYNRTSTDDHGIHIVAYKEFNGEDWYLIKDSGGAFRGPFKGYAFYRGDFIKLKMLTAFMHKDAVKDLLEKFTK